LPDRHTPAQRSYNMSRIRGFDTGVEVTICRALTRAGLRYRKHVMALPGRPDLVFRRDRLVVFIDGDFWHGYRYPTWRDRLSPSWQTKIERNRCRDRKNFATLRRKGWRVLRIWEHDVQLDVLACVERIRHALRSTSNDTRS
jgi:DNA mismatch endonuclease (patch repair protein)